MNCAFEVKRTLDMCSVDFMDRWQPGAIFRAMQDASGAHCDALHLSYEEMMAQGLAWVLTRARLCMDEYPAMGDEILIKTWPGKTRHTFFPRHYTFEKNGKEIGRSTTLYVLMDLETRKLALPARLATPLPEYDIPAPLPMPGNIAVLEGQWEQAEHTPVYTDFDRNGHVNNTRYVDWFMNRFPYERHARQELSELLIHYHFEVRPEEQLLLETQSQDGLSVMKGMSGQQLSFAVQGNWRDR